VLTVLVDDPATTSAADVLARWEQPWWRVLDWLLIVLGLGHAALGGWRALHQGTATAGRTVTASVLVLACALLAAGATVAIATTGR
jgi:succinate dehydrogenase hydrophobic anchor subunit